MLILRHKLQKGRQGVKKQEQEVFNTYVSDAVVYQKISKAKDNFELAAALGTSESFIRKANSNSEGKHYNAYHLWKLANYFEINISELYPPIKNDKNAFEQYKKIRPAATEEDFLKFNHALRNNYDI